MGQISQISDRTRFVFTKIFPLPFLIFGIMGLFWGAKELRLAQESLRWPVADGTIRNSSVEYHSSSDGGGTYQAEVFYQFTVDGESHSGNKVSFGDYGTSHPAHAQKIVNRYPQGLQVPVYYRGEEPNTCILEPGWHWQNWGILAFGILFFTVGSLLVICLPRFMKKN